MFNHRTRGAQILWGAIGTRLPTRGKHDVNAHIRKDQKSWLIVLILLSGDLLRTEDPCHLYHSFIRRKTEPIYCRIVQVALNCHLVATKYLRI